MGWQEDLARTNDPWLMTPAAVQASAAASNKSAANRQLDRGRKEIQNLVSSYPSETRNTYNLSPINIGQEIRNAYMDQRGSGIPWVNKGMNISDFLKSDAAKAITDQYGGYFTPRQAHEQWMRGETAPGTVDTRNDYQIMMNQLRDQYPEAYASEFPWSDAMMRGLPAIGKLALSTATGGASNLFTGIGKSKMGGNILNDILSLFKKSDTEDEEKYRYMFPYQKDIHDYGTTSEKGIDSGELDLFEPYLENLQIQDQLDQKEMTSKDYYDEFMDMFSPEEQAEVLGLENWRGTSGLMNGGIASLNGGGSWYGNPHMDPPSSTTTSSPTYGSPSPHGGFTVEANTPTPEVVEQQLADQASLQSQEDHLQAALSLAAAGISNIGGRPAGPGEFDLTNTLGVPVPGLTEGTPDEVFTFDESGLVDDTSPVDTGGEPSPTYDRHPGGTSYTGAPLFDADEGFEPPPEESPLKEQGRRQFDTQFMASQLLHDRSRGKFDTGGLANMSENTLGEFDTAKSKWKWKYDEQIKGLMDRGFSLKEAIDEMYNKYKMMPYKGFSMGAA